MVSISIYKPVKIATCISPLEAVYPFVFLDAITNGKLEFGLWLPLFTLYLPTLRS